MSTEDYTSAEKTKLAGIEAEANKTVVDSALSSTSANPVQNKVIQSALNGKANTIHSHGISDVTNLQTELDGLDSRIDSLESIKAIEVVSTLPTASSSTMNRLYVVSEDSKINVYYTVQNASAYEWHKMDSDILDELSLDWSEIENNPFSSSTPSSFANASHSHGQIMNDGKMQGTVITDDLSYFLGTLTSSGMILSTNHIPSSKVKDNNAHSNIGTTANNYQSTINTAIDTKIGTINTNIASKQDKGDCITSIELVPKSDDSTGAIKLYYGDEPSNNS